MSSMKSGVVSAVAVAVLGGCAALDSRPPGEVVKERAQLRWDAMVKSDFTAAYQYLSPGSRAVLTPEAYASGLKTGFWKGATVDRVICDRTDVCDAVMTIEYEFRGARIKTPLKETWIKEGSSWWFVQK
jgi:hypothetical protein